MPCTIQNLFLSLRTLWWISNGSYLRLVSGRQTSDCSKSTNNFGSSLLLYTLPSAPPKHTAISLFLERSSATADTLILNRGGNSLCSHMHLKVAMGMSMKSRSLLDILIKKTHIAIIIT